MPRYSTATRGPSKCGRLGPQELAAAHSNPATRVEDVARDLDAERFPEVIKHLRYHAADHPTHDSFLFVLDLILDGLDGPAR